MPKIRVALNERWPDYSINDENYDFDRELDVTDEQLEFIKKPTSDYNTAQDILARAYEGKNRHDW